MTAPPTPPGSFFAFSFPRAGSSLLEGLLRDVCAAVGMTLFNPSDELYRRGIRDDEVEFDPSPLHAPTGFCLGVFRGLPAFVRPHRLAGRKALLLVRDPADMLTSLYYSLAVSHVPPDEEQSRLRFLARRQELQSTTIDDFARSELAEIEGLLDGLIVGLRQADLRLYRYEDVIDRKSEWLHDIVAFLGLTVPPHILSTIVERHDVCPDDERPERHVRQVRPGDHLRKLRPDTIADLRTRISDRWRRLDYPRPQPHDDIAFPPAALQQMANPYSGVGCDVRLVGAERVAQIEPVFMPRAAGAHLHPDRGAEILGLWLEDEDGRPLTRLQAGGPFTLAYMVRLLTEEPVVFGFRIVDAAGAVVLGLNTEMVEAAVPAVTPPQLVEARWRLTAPGEGTHLLSCGCSRAENPLQMLARHRDAYAVTIHRAANAPPSRGP
jgi:hypothetical protein